MSAPPEMWWTSFLPLIIVGVVILGVLFLLVLGILMSRRVTITMRTGGAVALTLASILFLTGLWSMFLSPMATYQETKDSFYNAVLIDGLKTWEYTFSVQEGDTVGGSIGIRIDGGPNASGKTFNLRIYDANNNVVWSEANTTYSKYFNIRALNSGVYKVEVQNLNRETIEVYVQITISAKVTFRPLDPLGQWLSLISLPIFGLGVWASGLFAARQRKGEKELVKVDA